MARLVRFTLLPWLGLFAIAGAGRADVVVLTAAQDNTLYESATGALSNGAGEYLFAGRTVQSQDTLRRALLFFDVTASVPSGATIHAVDLTLNVSRTQAGSETMSLHRLLADWGEGTSDAPGKEGGGTAAASGDATWLHTFHSGSFWAGPGGDFAAATSASAAVGGSGFYTWSGAGLVADVQGWVDGTLPEFGWLLRGNEASTQTAKRFDSRENSKVQNRPSLTVDFTPPAASGACCSAGGTCAVPGGGAECAAQGGAYQGNGSVCTPNPCPPPIGACCLPDAIATCNEVLEATCVGAGGSWEGALSVCAPNPCPVVLTPFLDPLPIPAVAQPTSGQPGGTASYTIAMREVQQQLHSELANPTTVWGYGDGASASYPGPTIEATTQHPITVTWVNDLRDTAAGGNPPPLRTNHYLPVDTCPHGADDQSVRTVVHVHGAHVPAEFDGYPEDTFTPGNQVVYQYPNNQLPSTLWYHDHALGITRLNVYMGLAGLWTIRDNLEESLGLPACDGPCVPGTPRDYDVPIVIQDRTFNPDASLQYPATWQELFFGNTLVVNGNAWPHLDVRQGKYRFRLLNGCSSRTLTLALDNGASFQQIGAEGGLLPAPVTLNEVTLGPAERADVIIDFASYAAGTEIVLSNSAPAPFPGQPGEGVVPNVMQFRVQGVAGHTAPVPAALRSMEVLDENDAVHEREFVLDKGPGDACSPFVWEVISTKVDGVPVTVPNHRWADISEYPELETVEVWKFINLSGMSHPMHLHLVMFQVLDRQACVQSGGECVPIGSSVPPSPQEAGWKDTVQVGPDEIVRVIARFEDFSGLFSYHCHILEHEDHEMMRQFDAVSACSDGFDNDSDTLVDWPMDPGCTSSDDLSEVADCADGIDNDGDGKVDYDPSPLADDDPGCTSAADGSEKEPGMVCDDGLDNDGDGRIDYDVITTQDAPFYHAGLGDPGCRDPAWIWEAPQCNDGINNDGDPNIDYDGGAWATGSVLAASDAQCNLPFRNKERSGCGLGFELILVAAFLAATERRRGPLRAGRMA